MRKEIYVDKLADVTPEQARKVREGSAMLVYPATRGRFYKHVVRDKRGGWHETRGDGWGPITDQAARVLAPEIAEERAARRKARRKADAAANDYQVGDILHSSWGYDMVHCDYFQVVARTACTITIRHICWATDEPTGYMCGMATPKKDGFCDYPHWDDKENARGRRVRVGAGGFVNVTRDGVIHAGKWNGRPNHYDYCD